MQVHYDDSISLLRKARISVARSHKVMPEIRNQPFDNRTVL